MPLSTDNQDFTPNEEAHKKDVKPSEISTGPALGNMPLGEDVVSPNNAASKAAKSASTEDENNFDSDNQKGKKVDGDPSKESDQPAKLNQD